jgi:tripartite-type tricarboxylate transporter receptor subunit TctC
MKRRTFVFSAFVAASLGLSMQATHAADKVLTMVVSVPPGAGVDVMGRTLAQFLGPNLGQTIIVENKPGASSLVASSYVAKATPDGNTLLFAPDTILMAPHVLAKGAAGVDVTKDLVPIIVTSSAPMIIAVNPKLGVKSVKEFLDYTRRNPGATYGTSGTGSHFHIAGLLLERATGVSLTHVPYKGIADALTALLGEQVQAMIGVPSGGVAKMIEAKRVLPLAVLQKKRSPLLPEVPTLAEAGVPGLENEVQGSIFMLFAPAATPRPILSRLNEASRAALAMPEAQKRLPTIGMEPVASTLDEAIKEVREQYERNGRLVKEFGIHQ